LPTAVLFIKTKLSEGFVHIVNNKVTTTMNTKLSMSACSVVHY
jgi:hypothetical protein